MEVWDDSIELAVLTIGDSEPLNPEGVVVNSLAITTILGVSKRVGLCILESDEFKDGVDIIDELSKLGEDAFSWKYITLQ